MKREIKRLFVFFALITSLSFVVAGCSKQEVNVQGADETVQVEEPIGVPETSADEGSDDVGSTEISEAKGPAESLDTASPEESAESMSDSLEGRTSDGLLPVYFDFDRSFIRKDQVARLEKNGEFMKNNPRVKVTVEGNCDERGTNEYNMALGERRAMSAKKYLVNLGVEPGRLDVISYGEEKPINHGHDELSWSQNRRDDFVISQ